MAAPTLARSPPPREGVTLHHAPARDLLAAVDAMPLTVDLDLGHQRIGPCPGRAHPRDVLGRALTNPALLAAPRVGHLAGACIGLVVRTRGPSPPHAVQLLPVDATAAAHDLSLGLSLLLLVILQQRLPGGTRQTRYPLRLVAAGISPSRARAARHAGISRGDEPILAHPLADGKRRINNNLIGGCKNDYVGW